MAGVTQYGSVANRCRALKVDSRADDEGRGSRSANGATCGFRRRCPLNRCITESESRWRRISNTLDSLQALRMKLSLEIPHRQQIRQPPGGDLSWKGAASRADASPATAFELRTHGGARSFAHRVLLGTKEGRSHPSYRVPMLFLVLLGTLK